GARTSIKSVARDPNAIPVRSGDGKGSAGRDEGRSPLEETGKLQMFSPLLTLSLSSSSPVGGDVGEGNAERPVGGAINATMVFAAGTFVICRGC
ncbi:hypothetical protein U1Q18_035155, partial [Sarracenia purpurea var. burkii]